MVRAFFLHFVPLITNMPHGHIPGSIRNMSSAWVTFLQRLINLDARYLEWQSVDEILECLSSSRLKHLTFLTQVSAHQLIHLTNLHTLDMPVRVLGNILEVLPQMTSLKRMILRYLSRDISVWTLLLMMPDSVRTIGMEGARIPEELRRRIRPTLTELVLFE